jgi:hypothetical protein
MGAENKFKGHYPYMNWEHQLAYAQDIGLGSRKYNLIKLETPAYKNPGAHG